MELEKTIKLFKARGIRIEDVEGRNSVEGVFHARDIIEALKKEFDKQ